MPNKEVKAGRNEAKQRAAEEKAERIRIKDFFACIASSAIKFYADHYIVGGSYRCAWAVREYPLSTDEQTIIWLILYFNDERAEII